MADLNGDGALSVSEFRAAIAASAARGCAAGEEGECVAAEELERMFEAADVDKNGSIGFHEFTAAALLRRVELDDVSLHATFDAIDSEGLGYLTRESVLATVGVDTLTGGEHDIDLEQALLLADGDGDGKIDYAEFLAFVKIERLNKLNTPLQRARQLPPSPTQQRA